MVIRSVNCQACYESILAHGPASLACQIIMCMVFQFLCTSHGSSPTLMVALLLLGKLGWSHYLACYHHCSLKKTLRFKCYLSKPIVCKEDPHWCSVN